MYQLFVDQKTGGLIINRKTDIRKGGIWHESEEVGEIFNKYTKRSHNTEESTLGANIIRVDLFSTILPDMYDVLIIKLSHVFFLHES